MNSIEVSMSALCQRLYVLGDYTIFHWYTEIHFKDHITNVIAKTNSRLRQTYPIFTIQALTLNQNTILYKTILRPILLYACPAWGHAISTQTQRLQVLQNKIARIITGADRFTQITQLHESLALPYITDTIKLTAKRLKDKYKQHDNPLIRNSGQRQARTKLHYRTPNSLTIN